MEKREFWTRLSQRPNAVRYDELARLLTMGGWEHDRQRGSHHVFKRRGERITVPERRPHLLPVYVKDALRRTEGDLDD
jgi:predicted RNA binding protein YcfA (HicA-like mRNA interferase family)